MSKKLKNAKWMITYPEDTSISRDDPKNKVAVETFQTIFGLFWFFLRNKAAKAALRAERVRLFRISDQKREPCSPEANV